MQDVIERPLGDSGFDAAALARIYRGMYLSRALDDAQIRLKQQQKSFFQASGAGHEAVLVAAGLALAPSDWFYPYYRDQALLLALGDTPRDLLLEALGAAAAPGSAGRQMPGLWSSRPRQIVSQSAPTGMQFLQAVGSAEAGLRLAGGGDGRPREIVYVSSGEGATSEGEFWEAITTAATRRLPVLFLIEDNGYAISVPVDVQTPGGSISRVVSAIPDLFVRECDGTDPIASHAALADAAAYCRAGRGPALVHAHVVRAHAHSISDDDRAYRPDAERRRDAERDPLPRFRRRLVADAVMTDAELAALERAVDAEIAQAIDEALAAPAPDPATLERHVYSEDVDPTSAAFDTAPEPRGEPKTFVELVNACLRDELAANPRVVVFGQDVADVSRDALLGTMKGKGGVFKATAGLQRQFGGERVFNSPLAEANIVGRAIGMALRGFKPVVEIQFFDYIWTAMMQIRNELAVMRWRSKGDFACPVVVRVPIGGYLTGSAIYHSQSGETAFAHIPGLRVVMPSTALDANGLLRTAIRCDDPVLFLEPKHLYRQTYNRAPDPGPDYRIPFGRARVVREGRDLTIVTYGSTVQRSVQAAAALEREDGRSVEILDLRSLSLYDWTAVERSVRRTSRALVVHEDWVSWGYGAEIAARIGDELFAALDAPVRRVGAADVFCGYHPALEDRTLPQAADILQAARALLAF